MAHWDKIWQWHLGIVGDGFHILKFFNWRIFVYPSIFFYLYLNTGIKRNTKPIRIKFGMNACGECGMVIT